MELEGLIILLVIGGVAGWLAGLILKGGGFGLLGNIIVGMVGAFVGTFIFDVLDISIGAEAWVQALITSTVGAVVFLFLIGLIKK